LNVLVTFSAVISSRVEPSLYLTVLAVAIAVAPTVVAAMLVYRRRVSGLSAAAVLVYWGLFIVVLEHANWGITEFGGLDLRTHSGFHYQMLAAYGLAALALVGVVVAPLIRRGDAAGWWGLLAVFAVGVGAEVATAIVTTPHGVPPRFWIVGLALWAYPLAWGAALVLSFRPTFRPEIRRGAANRANFDRGPGIDTRELDAGRESAHRWRITAR
jgi:hypothetical protein